MELYANPKQQLFLSSPHKRKTFMGGRGVGKSTVLGFHEYLKFRHLARAKSALIGLTFNSLLNNTLPAMEQAWNLIGASEYDPKSNPFGLYVIGKRPPAHWPKPWFPPKKFEHVITWINGYSIQLMSQERADTNRGGNFDAGSADESALLKEEFVSRIASVSVRANRYRYDHPLHHSFVDFTSAPWKVSGQWIFKTEELMFEELEKVNKGILKPEDCQYLFVEAETADNLDVLGEDYLERQKRELSHWEYMVEIKNFRMKKLPNGFYPGLNTDRHLVIDVYEYDTTPGGRIYTKRDTFINSGTKLEVSFDFNAGFTSMIVCQETVVGSQVEFRIGDALFVKPEDTELNLIDALVDKFIDRYKDHSLKVIDIYGDRNGNSKSAQSTITFYEQIIQKLSKDGWYCTKRVDGLDMEHDLRHMLVNSLLNEEKPGWPKIRFHHDKAKPLVLSMQNAPILPGFKKDKADEKRPIPQELATHLSDCFDNIVCRKYPHLLTGANLHGIW